MNVRRLAMVGVAAVLTLGTCGCGLRSLGRDIERAAQQAVLEGRASVRGGGGPIVVVAYDADDQQVADLFVMPQGRPYFFVLPAGRYVLAAFQDRNRDLTYQPDEEPAGLGDPNGVVVGAGEQRAGLDLVIDPSKPVRLAFAVDGMSSDRSEIRQFPAPRLGPIVKMSDPRFSADNASLGLWDPVRFLFDVGAGVYFLEEYDPKKIPVLFVHGALGHPGNWSYLIGRLDRSRFQPWLAYYPTAPHIDRVAQMLVRAMSALFVKHQFPRLVIVAHSMGGLVARETINLAAANADPERILHLPAFVSISTPWEGHAAAAKGVERSPVVAPYWEDIAPGSDFLSALPETPLPAECRYTLLFGYGGSGGQANDGSVTLASQLSMPIQHQAIRVVGFDENHTSILRSAEVAAELNGILETAAR